MSTEFLMPSLGADMVAGKLVERLKAPGEAVARGDVVAVVETQKGAIEVEIFTDGILEKWLVEPGATVPVGTPLALVRSEDEAMPPRLPQAAIETPGRVRASPAARRLAAELGIDLGTLSGSGPDHAILSKDVASATAAKPPSFDAAAMREAISAAMARSKREIPHYYLETTIDLGRAREWLDRNNAGRPPARRLLMAALLAKAVAKAVPRVPEVNGVHVDGSFRASTAVHLGVAVAIRGGGLVAPALHDAGTLSLDSLMERLRDLVARARSGGLRSSEMSDPTLTVNNLGDRGAEAVYPIIIPPQVAIVGFGRESLRPWVIGNDVAARPLVTATLAADHRVSDGHRGGLFLAEIDRLLQVPEEL